MTKLAEWYPIYLKEMLLFKRKLFKLGYLFSAMVVPVVYLVAFGLGLGRSVQTGRGTYLDFLIPGLVAMSSMNNSYSWVASSLNLNRLYFKTFQVFVQAPISPFSIMVGEVLAAMTKGLFASVLIMLVGFAVSAHFRVSSLFIMTLLLNCFLFACLGIVTGMVAKSHEDTSAYSNFFILPMAFFSGTFFPVDRAPMVVKWIIYIMPLTHTNILIRSARLDGRAATSLAVLLVYTAAFFVCGSHLIRRYSE
ncbi:MAG TPA: ABC transporter permease [Syntrophorhabdales bacterium]|nr:ABC transporter permease [Syntrophorhabdales bacterium]